MIQYYYKAMVEKASGKIKDRRGVIHAIGVADAMDQIDDFAKGWKASIVKVSIHLISKDGELVLQTARAPAEYIARKAADTKKETSHSVTAPFLYPYQYSTMYQAPTFNILKLEDTK